ncbi:MAG TPA: DUF190 domain-containing protein [Stellaceae bacterium]|nr:DUF190 domain-containing protein [Stellaceae bacterium]
MPERTTASLLRIFLGADETFAEPGSGEQPLYEAIALRAREHGLAGLTVSRGILGFGSESLQEKILLRRSVDLPIVIEIVDSEAKIAGFLPLIDGMIGSGLATIERVEAIRYGGRGKS